MEQTTAVSAELVFAVAHALYLNGRLAVRRSAWHGKEQATFGDALAAVRQHLREGEYFSTSTPDTEWVNSFGSIGSA